MTFRIEQKLNIHKTNLFYLKKWLLSNNSKILHPSRIISSIYYDNNNFDMYHQSIEGVLPRKKIRIRYYPNESKKTFHIEKKISSVEGRYKEKMLTNIDLQNIKGAILDKDYGICNPKILVTYKRDYHYLKNTRITIDTDIHFYKIFFNKIMKTAKKSNKIAFELKNNINYPNDQLVKDFPFEIIRLSKYCEAVSSFSLS
jgi:SPX domain protein involved in polyphosphate accumulation